MKELQRLPIIISLSLIFILTITLNIAFLVDKTKYKKFIQEFIPQAINENIFSFPVEADFDIFDPKTNENISAIYAPLNIKAEEISKHPQLAIKRFNNKNDIPINSNALLYLPKPYLIAGNFHNEAYPHDTSYSIEIFMELIKSKSLEKPYSDKLLQIAKDQLDNFYFEVKHFHFPLNGNRAYFLSRSQANTIVSNVKDFYEITNDKSWLKKEGIVLAQSIVDYWLQGKVYLDKDRKFQAFKWIAEGEGKCYELMQSYKEHDFFYDKIKNQLELFSKKQKENPDSLPHFAKGFDYSKVLDPKDDIGLSDFYYYSDRLSKVSGYDTNSIYGPFNAFSDDFIPADHNLKLYKSLNDLVYLLRENKADKQEINKYSQIANNLKESLNRYLWDNEAGYFFEYNYNTQDLRNQYGFLSSAYALWAEYFDVHNPNDLEKLYKMFEYIKNNFQSSKGLYASNVETGIQWDKPYIWPVQQGMVIKGLIKYAELINDINPQKSKDFMRFALKVAFNFNNSNFRDWLNANGKSIKEKVTPENETLFTGYATGENYTWNMATVLYFDALLNYKI